MSGSNELSGPDLAQGIAATEIVDGGLLLGHAHGESVVLARRGGEVFAVSGTCSHYGGPLAEGLLVGDTLRCPWHHACFSLRDGEALAAPALNPIACFELERRGERLFVLGRKPAPVPARSAENAPESIVIVGGGAAGHAAAEMLRRQGYGGCLTLLSADGAPPSDRPNLSKDYLAGTAPEEWIPLRPEPFFREQGIDLVLNARVVDIDAIERRVLCEGGRSYPYQSLLLATGAEPVQLDIPGAELPHVHTLRTLADSRAIIAGLSGAKHAVVLGASFIGLEVAASLRARGLEVRVVAPDALPLARVLGPELGGFIRSLHEEHGVVFHLGQTAESITRDSVILKNDEALLADIVVAGIGVRPSLALAEKLGLRLDRGVLVDQYLQTSVPGIYAAGDMARWPDPHSGEPIRVEHWVVAQRQGQIAARNLLGQRVTCDLVPFFWSQHYDVQISYVGHAEKWERIQIEGNLAQRDARLTFFRGERALAVATIGRDLQSLRAEAERESRQIP